MIAPEEALGNNTPECKSRQSGTGKYTGRVWKNNITINNIFVEKTSGRYNHDLGYRGSNPGETSLLTSPLSRRLTQVKSISASNPIVQAGLTPKPCEYACLSRTATNQNYLVLLNLTEHTRPYAMEWLPASERHADELKTSAANTPSLHYWPFTLCLYLLRK